MDCPHCGQRMLRHARVRQMIRDLDPAKGRVVRRAIERVRYCCRDCRVTLMDDCPDVARQHQLSQRLVDWIRAQDTGSHTLARQTGLSERTIRHVRQVDV